MAEGDGTKYGKYIISELVMPEARQKIDPEYRKYARRVRWLDADTIPGAFNVNTAWYLKAGPTLENKPHVHDVDEVIAFIGSDPEDPDDLGGEIELWMDDEKHIITKTTLVFIPAGLVHCPLILNRVDRPIFHFHSLGGGQYRVV